MKINYFYLFLFCFLSCKSSLKQEYLYDKGKIIGEIITLENDTLFVKIFHENTQDVKYEHFEKNGLREKVFKSYYPSGNLKLVQHYKNNKIILKDTLYYESGDIKFIANYEDGFINGKAVGFDEKGRVNAEHYFYMDSIYHSIMYTYEQDSLINKKNGFKPIIKVDKGEYHVGDTVYLSFLLPYKGNEFNLEQFQLTYDYFDPEVLSKKEVMSLEKYEYFENTKVQVKFNVDKPGEWKIICYLHYIDDSGELIQHLYNSHTVYVKDN